MSQDKKTKIQNFIKLQVKPIFDKLITELTITMPIDIIQWSIEWLKNYTYDKNQKSHSESENDDEALDDLHTTFPQHRQSKIRQAVSAEAYGQYNKKDDFKARVITKTKEQIDRIKSRLPSTFMFSALDDREQKIVIDAMEIKQYKAGDWIIKQGDDGNDLYVIDIGESDCYKQFSPEEQPKYLKTYKPGESFGELALLYNTPRAASIQAKSDTTCFALDRQTFNNIVKESAIKKRQQYEEMLSQIEILKDMDDYERGQLCDAIKEIKFQPGEIVLKQGDQADLFYMIHEGKLQVTKFEKLGDQPQIVYEYESGDYFGEISLLNDVPRQATVTTNTDCVLLCLAQESFKRLMGPIENILKRNMDRYKKYGQI